MFCSVISCCDEKFRERWSIHLPPYGQFSFVLLTTTVLCSVLFLGSLLRTGWDPLRPDTAAVVYQKHGQQKHHTQRSQSQDFQIDQDVLVHDFQGLSKWADVMLKQQLALLTYLVKLSNGILWKRHIEQIHTRGPSKPFQGRKRSKSTNTMTVHFWKKVRWCRYDRVSVETEDATQLHQLMRKNNQFTLHTT